MKIKTRLSLYFTLISSGSLLLVLIALYIAVYSFFTTDFYNRLTDRTNLASQLYLKADELAADSLLEIQQQYLEKLSGEVIRIYDQNNTSAFKMDHNIYWTKNIINQVRKEGYLEYEEGKRKVVGKYYHDNQGDFVILASAIDINSQRRMIILGQIASVLFIVFGVILFFAGRMFAQKALSPVDKIIAQIRNIRSSNLYMRVTQVKSKDEIAELINNFNSLLAHLQNAFELQQTFVANASHELRTPLTSIMGEVEVALEKDRDKAEYERILASIATDGARLQETITSLMELAQVDLNYTQAKLSPVRVDELIWELEEQWSARKGAGRLKIQLAALPDDEEVLTIPANKSMLYIALNNIIDNAFKYSEPHPVTMSFEATASRILISVSDEGPGISKENAEKIFNPFYRANKDKSISGSGIGLYITSKIIELFKGTIRVVSDAGKGSTFVVEFIRNNTPA
ncbi:sensor histidine kinase [Mucilaginibacter phyllosphaerae]|uniref:histidine kinase n=1 Tax=Mucilaginibacter phyllosphaerae TaxID=1812349 RepID=A0A4Y8ACX2_9SPHI|nr:HAMP domain-containing sensor histidine kinase [Mucilaginibacter phyllosphaerae]MBB3969426.1 signal transduction histidine kinase [Mucilaginibacter phyllosphaerae]TEW65788.1 HAMP domain-containing histidine kinase [Mucilaginibacter phyllosphaerae]GGH08452.1 two-component sensor histidine kinase [Mucilaginibacter phyllosphaerae]